MCCGQFYFKAEKSEKNTSKSGYFHELFKFQTAIEAIEASLILSHKCTKNMYSIPFEFEAPFLCRAKIEV